VVSSNLFEHLKNETQHLREIRRVLRPAGIYFVFNARTGRASQQVLRFVLSIGCFRLTE
jgi:ubiquinone/menaquinone biosynthesis C-methylase UbiE